MNPMHEIVRCKECGENEYYGMMHCLDGKEVCRKCIYDVWEKRIALNKWTRTEKDYVFPIYSDGENKRGGLS